MDCALPGCCGSLSRLRDEHGLAGNALLTYRRQGYHCLSGPRRSCPGLEISHILGNSIGISTSDGSRAYLHCRDYSNDRALQSGSAPAFRSYRGMAVAQAIESKSLDESAIRYVLPADRVAMAGSNRTNIPFRDHTTGTYSARVGGSTVFVVVHSCRGSRAATGQYRNTEH